MGLLNTVIVLETLTYQ